MLTAYNGTAITHDGIGNPLNDGTWSYSWDGRQLNSMTDGTTTWSYEYDFDGLRTERSNGSTTYEYVYSGSSLVQMTVGSNILRFAYDGTAPMTVTCNGTVYYYVTNLQGDVIAILDGSGNAVVQYTYDAWGNLLGDEPADDTIGHLNPLRYRGYVYDPETKFYYLQSRYYDPKLGRFLNADAFASTGQGLLGNNMFAYCLNNPVILGDFDGYDAVVLYKESGVGHIGFLVQDENGDWWHFYWGADGALMVVLSVLACDVPEKSWCIEYSGDPSSLDEINKSGQYAGTYVNSHYLYGDFSAVLDLIENLSGDYNLYRNNCGQVSMRLLASADTTYQDILTHASTLWMPSEIDSYLTSQLKINNINSVVTTMRGISAVAIE